MTFSLDIPGISSRQGTRLLRASERPGPWTKSRINTILREIEPEPALAALNALRGRLGSGLDVLDAICLWRVGDATATEILDRAIAAVDDLASLTVAQQVLLDMSAMGLPWGPERVRAIWNTNFADRTACIRDMAPLIRSSVPDPNQMALASHVLGRAISPHSAEGEAVVRASLIRLHDLSLRVACRQEPGLSTATEVVRDFPDGVRALARGHRSIVSLASHWGCTFVNPAELDFADHRPIRIRLHANQADETAVGTAHDAGRDAEMIRDLRRGRTIIGFAADVATGRTPIIVPLGHGKLTLARSAVMIPRLGDAALIYTDMFSVEHRRVLRTCLGPDPRDFEDKETWSEAVIAFCRSCICRTIERAVIDALDPVWDKRIHRRPNI